MLLMREWALGCAAIVLSAVALLPAAAVRADVDLLVRTDGSVWDGKVVSQDDDKVVFHPDGSRVNHVVPRNLVAKVLTTDDHGALLKDTSAPGDHAEPKWDVLALPTAPPVEPKKRSGFTYCLIPLHGEVGSAILASALERSLDDAIARHPDVVVLDIDSPGGSVEEAKRIISTLRRYNRKVGIVALCGQDLSAAAIFTMSVRDIYLKPGATIGAATSFRIGPEGTPTDVEEKFQSAWRAVARGSAEEGRHEPLLAEAMIDASAELHLEKDGDQYVVKEGRGDVTLCHKGKILTLTGREAVRCGLAVGVVDDVRELGRNLNMKDWTETPSLGALLAEVLPKRSAAFEAEMQKVKARLLEHVRAAASADPSEEVVTITRIGPGFGVPRPMMPTPMPPRYPPGMRPPGYIPPRVPTPPMPPMPSQMTEQTITHVEHKSPEQWKPESLACTLAMQQLEADLRTAASLCTAYDRTAEAEAINEVAGKFASLRAEIFDNRNKFAAAAAAAAAAQSAPGAGRRPATRPAQTVDATDIPAPTHITINNLPDGRMPTDQVGGDGGSPFITMKTERTPVIGFRYEMGSWNNRACFRSIRPLYEAPTGDAPPPDRATVVARDGYVVGGIKAVNDRTNLVAIKVVFIRYRNGALKLDDQYESDWIGESRDASAPRTLACNGQLVVGVYGRQGLNQDAFGLIVWGKPAAAAAAAATSKPAAPKH